MCLQHLLGTEHHGRHLQWIEARKDESDVVPAFRAASHLVKGRLRHADGE